MIKPPISYNTIKNNKTLAEFGEETEEVESKE